MSITKRNLPSLEFRAVAARINTAMAAKQFDTNGAALNEIMSMESIHSDTSKLETASSTEDKIAAFLGSDGDNASCVRFDELMMNHLGVDSVNHPCVVNAIDAAVATIIAGEDGERWNEKVQSTKDLPSGHNSFHDAEHVSLEGFGDVKFKDEYIGISAIVNALAAGGAPATELFYRTVVLTAGQGGVDFDVVNPVVYTRKTRNADGSAYELVKIRASRALVDNTLLQGHQTKIVPVATGNNDGVLVANDVIASKDATVGGEEVKTRPYVYGKDIDLIVTSLSNEALGASSQDESDTLDPNASLGVHYVKVDNETKVGIIPMNLDNLHGASFQPTATGSVKDLLTIFETPVPVRGSDLVTAGATVESTFGFAAILGLNVDDNYAVEFLPRITATIKLTASTINCNLDRCEIARATYINDDGKVIEVDETKVQALRDKIAGKMTGVGFVPTAFRSNSNMRNPGRICDFEDTIRGRVQTYVQSPLSIVGTANDEKSMTLDGANMIQRIIRSNEGVRKLWNDIELIKRLHGNDSVNSIPGAVAGVLPTYIERKVDASKQTVVESSETSLKAFRGLMVAQVKLAIDAMMEHSGYEASLWLFTGSTSNYEFVLTTSEAIYSHLMESGDPRTLGLGRNFSIAKSHDATFHGKIVISVRRTDVSVTSVHDFGTHPIAPTVMFTAKPTRGGSTKTETILQPSENWGLICPVVAVIEVTGMSSLFSTATPVT